MERISVERATSVAGIHVPAFVERPPAFASATLLTAGVAGIHVPAFVERSRGADDGHDGAGRRVAGIHVPAFVERRSRRSRISGWPRVSPGFTSRPSLSAHDPAEHERGRCVSPGFTSRPSLSGLARHYLS